MNKKELAIKLSTLKTPETFTIKLEQYQLEGELAAELLWKAFLNGDIKNKLIADFGCGNGILGTGALLLNAKNVYFIDTDKKMITLAKENSKNKGIYLTSDIRSFEKNVDTVLMNPPFGVQERKADKIFLEKAMTHSSTIYSLHKIESKPFIKKITEEYNFHIEEILERNFLLKKTYPFHKKNKYLVKIGIWILRKI